MGSVDDIAAGTVLDARYEVVELLGEGGFGVVYKARQISTGQFVAVKLLHPARASGARADAAAAEMARFKREMALIAQLKHPNIVRLIDSGQLDGGHLFTVLEYIDGEELAQRLERDGPLPLRDARRLMTQVLEALATAHAHGVVHRDLKPQNIMVTGAANRRNAMVLDFGVAGLLESARGDDYQALTAAGRVLGTLSYMAPEQLRGQPLTPCTDLYAAGLVALECLTGRRAATGTQAEVMAFHCAPWPIPIPSEVSEPTLRHFIARAAAKSLDERYADAGEALADLLAPAGASHIAQQLPPRLDAPALDAPRAAASPEEVTAQVLPSALAASAPAVVAAPEAESASEAGAASVVSAAAATTSRARSMVRAALLALIVVLAGTAVVLVWLLTSRPRAERSQEARADDPPNVVDEVAPAGNVEPNDPAPQQTSVEPAAPRPCAPGDARCDASEHGTSGGVAEPPAPEPATPVVEEREAKLRARCHDGGEAGACLEVATLLEGRPVGEREPWLRKACRLGSAEACLLGARLYPEQLAAGKLERRVRRYYQRACDGGLVEACFELASVDLPRGNDPEQGGDAARAALALEKACRAGHGESCFVLGNLLMTGRGDLSADPTRARGLYGMACALEHEPACAVAP